MAAAPWGKIIGGVVLFPRYADRGSCAATVAPHPYLSCWTCDRPLHAGRTDEGAPVFACRTCGVIVDGRRIP